ncbi:hypothetical protein [Aquimarina litoralis]|uniref:hypothetical protein n=1 Tax=Aquimarina litoralis TaxID=584605 RepID=UPI001C5828EF|nr:hypothetical protein [Aquimarina litoralis]MBW1294141.1 hypothetical protein [Aquimarina litoralis]
MKKGCLIVLVASTVIVASIISYIFIFPAKPASEEKRKEILLTEYNSIKASVQLNKYVEILEFLEMNRSLILDSLTGDSENDIFLDLNYYNQTRPSLPIKLLNELSMINSINKIYYQLQITNDQKFLLTNKTTDYNNYLYIIHNLHKTDTSTSNRPTVEKYIKTLYIDDKFQYTIMIKDAFNDIDPNNFAPN